MHVELGLVPQAWGALRAARNAAGSLFLCSCGCFGPNCVVDRSIECGHVVLQVVEISVQGSEVTVQDVLRHQVPTASSLAHQIIVNSEHSGGGPYVVGAQSFCARQLCCGPHALCPMPASVRVLLRCGPCVRLHLKRSAFFLDATVAANDAERAAQVGQVLAAISSCTFQVALCLNRCFSAAAVAADHAERAAQIDKVRQGQRAPAAA